MKIKIAIVEDDKEASKYLKNLIYDFKATESFSFNVDIFENAFQFEEHYSNNYDLIFLDIEMPGKNGMDLAKWIRERNENLTIIFTTNLAQYAVEGYEVRAFDFIVKPLNKNDFFIKFTRILNYLKNSINDEKICVKTRNGETTSVSISSIKYIEVKNHDLIYHLNNKEITTRGTMNSIENSLSKYNFSRSNSCYLINLKYVTKIVGDTLEINDLKLKISQSRRKSFLIDFAKYAGGTK